MAMEIGMDRNIDMEINMDQRIAELIQFTQHQYGLEKYVLHQWEIVSSITFFNKTSYTLSMVWFPMHIRDWHEESVIPDGTMSITLDIFSRKANRIIFNKELVYTRGLTFNTKNSTDIIKWIENETGLIYGTQFEISKEKSGDIYFKACINGISVSPSSYIHVKFNKHGQLVLFSAFGHFPKKEEVKEDLYTLTLAQVKALTHEQLKLIEFPNQKSKEFVPVYAIEEIYIKNNDMSTLTFEIIDSGKSRQLINKAIEWKTCASSSFQKKEFDFSEHVFTPDEAFRCEPHPDLQPINEKQCSKCINVIGQLLSTLYPHDSGKWVLKWLYRENGYIQAMLKHKEQEARIVSGKLLLYLDSDTCEVQNYLDNKLMLNLYDDYKGIGGINVTKEDAFHKLMDVMELKPYYVFDADLGYYTMCGLLDCHYGVNAYNGEIVALNDLFDK